jgi:hypothetical protein
LRIVIARRRYCIVVSPGAVLHSRSPQHEMIVHDFIDREKMALTTRDANSPADSVIVEKSAAQFDATR